MSQLANPQQPPAVVRFPEAGSRPKLLDRVRHAIGSGLTAGGPSRRTVDWIRRYIVFHKKKHPSTMGAPEISRFLSWLATARLVSSSTQNQALSAVLFLYRHVLCIDVHAIEQVPRAKMPHRVPVVLTLEEVGRILKEVQRTAVCDGASKLRCRAPVSKRDLPSMPETPGRTVTEAHARHR